MGNKHIHDELVVMNGDQSDENDQWPKWPNHSFVKHYLDT
jgi:hypothetical protein